VNELLASDEGADLAVLRSDSSSAGLTLSQRTPKVGEEVVAIGNPLALISTLSNGVVSGMRELEGVRHIQTTAPISPGSSGGVLLNLQGEVIGVTTFNLREAQNLNFAVAVEHVRSVLRTEKPSPLPASSEAKPVPPAARDFKVEQAEIDELMNGYNRLKTYREKVRFLSDWIDEDGRSPMAQAAALIYLGGQHETHDEQQLALSSFESALSRVNEVGGTLNPIYYRLCRSYIFNRRFHEAVDACEAAVDEARKEEVDGGELKNSWSHLGYANEKVGRYDAAMRAYDHALDIDPSHEQSLIGLVRVYDATSNTERRRAVCARLKKENAPLWRKVFPYGC